jgi:ADP-ribosyl-[dinitrogen reductase] hydrolase
MLLGRAAGEASSHAIHGLPVGAWADKTAMALCLAESLVSQDGPDGADQVARYREWQHAGIWSSTGSCVGISAATSKALAAAQWSGNPYSGSHDPAHADAEPLARIGPAVAWYHATPAAAIDAAINAARVTHQAPLTLDAVRLLSALISGALAGESRDALLSADFTPDPEAHDPATLRAPLRELAGGAWRGRRPRRILRGKYAAVAALESALAAFEGGEGFARVIEAAASRPGDAGTAAAIAGQLAGAHYGAMEIPRGLRAGIARADEIEALADRLVDAAPRARGS